MISQQKRLGNRRFDGTNIRADRISVAARNKSLKDPTYGCVMHGGIMTWVKWITAGLSKWRLLLGVAPAVLKFVALSAWGQAGALDISYQPSPSSSVSAVVIQPDGKALIGGGFWTVNGFDRRGLARLNIDGTLDTNFVAVSVDGQVKSIVLQPDGKILIGGQFSSAPIARLQSNGSVDNTFNFGADIFSGFDGMALQQDGKVLLIADDLIRLMPDGSLDTNFQWLRAYQWITNGDSAVTTHNSFFCVNELSDGKILVGGWIAALAGQAVGAGLIRLNADGTWDTSFTSSTNEGVSAMLVQPDHRIVAEGNGRLSRFNTNGTLDVTFNQASIEGSVFAIARQVDGKILVGGYYQRAAGVLRPGIARFNVDGTLDRNFDAGDVSGFTVTSIATQFDTKIVMGGFFTSVNGQNRPYMARLQNDNPSYAGRFEFLSVSNAVLEAAGNLVIPVMRYGGNAGSGSVVVAATGWGSAQPGQDYLSITQTLVFVPGQTSNAFTVPIINDAQVEGPYAWERFDVYLSSPTGGPSLGSERGAVGYILEDDTGIAFQSSYAEVTEASGQAAIELVRLGITNPPVGVSFQMVNGTATSPDDFTDQAGLVSFAAGETNKTIVVLLNDDALVEGEERFSLRLSAPTGGASLAYNSNVTVRIIDDVSFMAFDESVTANPTIAAESDGHTVLKVRRWGRTNNMVSAHFMTSNLTALAGSDYQATSGTLTLLPGQIEATITVPILDDPAVEEMEQFQMRLSEPTGTLVLAYGTVATVSVISDDGAGYPDTHFRPAVPGGGVFQLALAPGDKILVRGERVLTNAVLLPTLLRFNPDGAADPTFQHHLDDDVYWISASPDGKVYVCSGYGIGINLRRLLANGETDPAFDPFYVDYRSFGAPVRAMVLQADGKAIVSAYPAPYYGYERTTNLLNRLNVDGTYDLEFGPVFQLGDERLTSAPDALALQPDGTVLLAAALTSSDGEAHVRVVRLTTNGQFDMAFNPPEITGPVRGIRMLDTSALIYGGFTDVNGIPRAGMAVLDANGALDPSFVPPFESFDYFDNGILAAVVQGDGKVVFSGHVRLSGGGELLLGRLNATGSLDLSFTGSYSERPVFDLALQADGKVLAAGSIGPIFGSGLDRLNNDPNVGAGFVEFSSASRTIDETDPNVSVTVRRVGGTNGLVRVPYATIAGTATNGADFTAQSGIITFTAGELGERTVVIPLLDDTLAEGDESFLVSLGAPLGGATWGETSASAITLRENDTAIQFPNTLFYIRENAGTKIVDVQRIGRKTGVASINYVSSNASAEEDLDYVAQAGTLIFGDGETNRQLSISLLDDQLSESNETLTLTLSHPSPGVMLGTNSAVEVTIVDNDRPGTLDESFDSGPGSCTGSVRLRPVRAMVVQPDGRILVGGEFAGFNSMPGLGLARLLPSGAVDESFAAAFPIPTYGLVDRLMLQPDGKILAVLHESTLVRLNADGSPDYAFGLATAGNPGEGEPGFIKALLPQLDGGILVAGRFDQLNGVGRTNLARITADGSIATALTTQLAAGSQPGWVMTLASDLAGRLLVGGIFDTVDGVTRHGLARFDTNGTLDLAFAPAFTNSLNADLSVNLRNILVLPNGQLIISGLLWEDTGEVFPFMRRLNSDGSWDTTFNVVISNHFYVSEPPITTVLRQPDDRLLIAGHFTHVNGIARRNVARLNSDGSLDLTFHSGEIETDPDFIPESAPIYAMALQPDGQLLIGGELSEVDGQTRCGIARLNGVGLRVSAMTRDMNGQQQIRFSGMAGVHYNVLASSNLTEWTVIGAAVEITPGMFQFTETNSPLPPFRFYRLRLP